MDTQCKLNLIFNLLNFFLKVEREHENKVKKISDNNKYFKQLDSYVRLKQIVLKMIIYVLNKLKWMRGSLIFCSGSNMRKAKCC